MLQNILLYDKSYDTVSPSNSLSYDSIRQHDVQIYLCMRIISSKIINHSFMCLCNTKLALTDSHYCGVTMVTLISAACDVISACNFELMSFFYK